MVDERHMERAIQLAREWPHTHPNPRVGAVVVSPDEEVVGEGWHRGPGTDHAEIIALREAADNARGSTVYVSLEPCSHHGRTPPCVDALIAAGVSTVVIATIDPDVNVSGSGVEGLRNAGLEVITGVHEDDARQVDPAYFHHRETGLAMVTVKWAMTLDGSTAAADGTSKWISGPESRREVHELRSRVDGVVVGAGTLRADDPTLSVRLDDFDGPQPRPVIIAGREELPHQARIWERDPIVVSTRDRPVPSGEILEVPGVDGCPDPTEACRALGERGLLALLMEGGPTIVGAWWRGGVVRDGHVYIASKIGGGSGKTPMGGLFTTITEAEAVEFRSVRSVGDDVVISFEKRD